MSMARPRTAARSLTQVTGMANGRQCWVRAADSSDLSVSPLRRALAVYTRIHSFGSGLRPGRILTG